MSHLGVKEEVEDDKKAGPIANATLLTNEDKLCPEEGPINYAQTFMLKRFLKAGTDWKRLDPSQDNTAIKEWQDLIHDCDIRDLRNTHSTIATTFRNGMHRGQDVKGLVRDLVDGRVQPSELPPLVAVRLSRRSQELYVVCGNRRTRALHDFAAQ
eukprot:CAMPEP_0180810502 /NCGR_PEP_ID=MMETSP1038_2-20121128/64919_1 /TAXON_ID=632150 /ORGANISM="Azadinium spinosum, Strain 3D9" /LENGTH=154 /DNA_ID=CAMNT_0022851797 /DNA_START=29 /DNA_END=490 /DNA_ORIENTATION=+